MVLDNLTNNIRHPTSGIRPIKPMQTTDVTPYNTMLSDYLRTQGRSEFGCQTQIRLSCPKNDGYHVLPQYDSTIDKTYACALMGIPVPCPTPMDEFTPNHIRGLVAGVLGRYHADQLFARHGMLKVGDLYRQQLRAHAWQFWNGRLPENQVAMLSRTCDVHGHATLSARSGLFLSTKDQRSVGYRVPREWSVLPEAQRGAAFLATLRKEVTGGVTCWVWCVCLWGGGLCGV